MANSLTSAQQKELKDAFDMFDTDQSGKISQKELGRIFKALNIPINANQLKQLVADMDADNSGEIEFGEFCRVMAATFFKKHTQEELRAAFRQFDQDGSGYIQAQELSNIMNRMGRHVSKAELDAMINSLDNSGDGKISFEEFQRLF